MVREININFTARQAVLYLTNGETERLIGTDFDQFEKVLPIAEKSLEKSPEKIEAEKQAEIANIETQITILNARKKSLETEKK